MPTSPKEAAKKRPLLVLVSGLVFFGGGGAVMLYLNSIGKATTFLEYFGASTSTQSTFVTIVSWFGIVLGALCVLGIVREIRRGRRHHAPLPGT